MSTTTTHAAALTEAVAAYKATFAALEEAKGKGDKKAVASLGSKLANRTADIRRVRYAAAEDGEILAQPELPKTTRTRTAEKPSQESLQASLDKAYGVRFADVDEDLKHAADIRITAVLKLAKKHGYTLKTRKA